MACEVSDIKKLNYEIHKYSSYLTSYSPENVRDNCPSNSYSRWSTVTNTPPQYLTLKLQRPAIVKKIKFGKYEKNHVCNLRKFKIFGGLDEEHMILLFEGGLKNDTVPETFNIEHKTESGDVLPIFYLQIMPLLSWGPSFNCSIWYVELLGQDDPIFVRTTAETSFRNFNTQREVEIVRLCLKHFRLQGYDKAFEALQEHTNVQLEHSMISQLHKLLVNDGDFKKVELFIDKCAADGLMDAYVQNHDYKPTWELQETTPLPLTYENISMLENLGHVKHRQSDIHSYNIRPGMRGGHQIVVDSDNGVMYLYGGWDGFEDLSDLWVYDIKTKLWSLIHENSDLRDGPSPRSCHKMVFDPANSQIFVLGRYLDQSSRTRDRIKSDFYLYDADSMTWLQICDDTSQVGGPQLLFDHQMCIDVEKRTIYVFGGRILSPRSTEDLTAEYQYSGLFSYQIGTNTWTEILIDCGHPSASDPDRDSIKSRVTHSMLFHNKHRKLYIFGGQRNKDYIKDFISYDVDTNDIAVLNPDPSSVTDTTNVPQPGFTQRATIDCDRNEIYVLSSLSKDKERRDLNVNSFWLYSLNTNEWKIIYKNDHTSDCHTKSQNMCSEPCPRYAHQLVYDSVRKVHYLFGGNPGKKTHLRLDDFWILYLQKPNLGKVLRQCKFLIRRLEYEEITRANKIEALKYLQTRLHEIIDHDDPVQLKEFHKLASLLFSTSADTSSQHKANISEEDSSSNEACSGDSDMISVDQQTATRNQEVDTDSMDSNVATPMISTRSGINSLNSSFGMTTTDGKAKHGHSFQIKSRRSLLFNRLVEFLPNNLVQPKGNLSDLIMY